MTGRRETFEKRLDGGVFSNKDLVYIGPEAEESEKDTLTSYEEMDPCTKAVKELLGSWTVGSDDEGVDGDAREAGKRRYGLSRKRTDV